MKNIILVNFILILIIANLFGQEIDPPSVKKMDGKDVYQISSLEDLRWIAENESSWGGSFIQTEDINASETETWPDGGWKPIGNNNAKFTGSYDGGGHTINDLYINRPDTRYQGMFGYISGGNVSNLFIRNVDFTGSLYTGGLAGYVDNAAIFYRIGTTGRIGNSSRTGGLVGTCKNSNITECYSSINILGNSPRVGGLLADSSANTIKDCYSLGDVFGDTNVSGLCAYLENSAVENTYSSGFIEGSSKVGGLFGSVSDKNTVSASYWDEESTNQISSAGKGTRELTQAMTMQSTFANWDFTNVWKIAPDGETYPYLAWQKRIELGNIPKRQLAMDSGVYKLAATIGGAPLSINFETTETTETPSDSRITCQYTTHRDIPIITSFADSSSYRAYYRFEFTHPEQLTSAEYFTLRFNDQINHIWGRLDEGNWKELPFTKEEDGVHFTINNLENLSSGTRNHYSAIEFVGSFKELHGLPVELSSFTIRQVVNHQVELNWTSETETNLLGYNVYRSECNQLSQAVRMNLAIIGGHNTSTQKRYSFEDSSVELEKEYYYWLESIDLDLTNVFYEPTSIFVENTYPGGETIIPQIETKLYGAYPNPFNPSTNILFNLEHEANVTIQIFNINGQKIDTLISESFYLKGVHSIPWEDKSNNLSSGVYIIDCKVGNDSYRKKMLMLK